MKDKTKNQNFEVVGLEDQPELRAHIYQQIQELSPYMLPDTQAGLIVKKNFAKQNNDPSNNFMDQPQDSSKEKPDGQTDQSDNSPYLVTLFLKTGGVQVEASASRDDVFSATISAKENLIKNLSQYQDEVISNRERELEVLEALNSPYLH